MTDCKNSTEGWRVRLYIEVKAQRCIPCDLGAESLLLKIRLVYEIGATQDEECVGICYCRVPNALAKAS